MALPAREAERRLAAEAAAGDQQAFAALFESHREQVYRVARAVTGDGEAAKDVVQETFVKVYLGLARWRADASLRTWIVRIAVRTAIDHKRRSKRRPAMATGDEPAHDPRPGLEDALALARVQQLAERLEGRQGLILRLRLLGDLSNREIAEALGLREPNVRMQVTKAVRRLREML